MNFVVNAKRNRSQQKKRNVYNNEYKRIIIIIYFLIRKCLRHMEAEVEVSKILVSNTQ